MKKIFFILLIICSLISCSHKTTGQSENEIIEAGAVVAGYSSRSEKTSPQKVRINGKLTGSNENLSKIVPNATIFRMSGDYSSNVAVTLNSDGFLIYFPAPSDITADSEPIELTDGWWLNRQGLGPNSVFTKYTFAEYAALPETPSPSQLKLEIIPGARVTEFKELQIKLMDAENNIEEVIDYIKSL